RAHQQTPPPPPRPHHAWPPFASSSPAVRSVLRVHVLRHRLANELPLPTLLGAGQRVDPSLVMGGFALELTQALVASGGNRPVGERRGNRAARLAVVAAVAEPAAPDQL